MTKFLKTPDSRPLRRCLNGMVVGDAGIVKLRDREGRTITTLPETSPSGRDTLRPEETRPSIKGHGWMFAAPDIDLKAFPLTAESHGIPKSMIL